GETHVGTVEARDGDRLAGEGRRRFGPVIGAAGHFGVHRAHAGVAGRGVRHAFAGIAGRQVHRANAVAGVQALEKIGIHEEELVVLVRDDAELARRAPSGVATFRHPAVAAVGIPSPTRGPRAAAA